MKSLSVLSLALTAVLALGGCLDLEEEEPEVGSSGHMAWSIGTATSWVEWDSGKTNNLSGWKSLHCNATYGADYMLTHMRAFKEPVTNLDNFVAKLRGSCTRYGMVGGVYEQVGNSINSTIFSANHRTPGGKVGSADERYPIGVTLTRDWGNNYVKNIQILSVEHIGNGVLGPYANPFTTTTALSGQAHFTGPWIDVACPDQQVMTGVKLRYSTNNGKIRRFRVYCRPLSN